MHAPHDKAQKSEKYYNTQTQKGYKAQNEKEQSNAHRPLKGYERLW